MDDRDIVAAMRASPLATLAGIAGAYDKYAAPLFRYCWWLLGEPDDAAAVVLDTFQLAMTDLRGIRDPEQLCSHLYAVARDECQHRTASSSAAASRRRPPIDRRADRRGGLRRLIVDALAELDDREREVVELKFGHGLGDAGVAFVLGMPRRQASALAARVQARLEERLAAPIVAYTGTQACPVLNTLLPGWDGRLTLWTTGLVQSHIEECPTCKSLRYQAFQPAVAFALESRASLPAGLRAQVIGLCVDSQGSDRSGRGQATVSHARFGALLAFAAIAIWIIAAVSVTLLTILGRPIHLSHLTELRTCG